MRWGVFAEPVTYIATAEREATKLYSILINARKPQRACNILISPLRRRTFKIKPNKLLDPNTRLVYFVSECLKSEKGHLLKTLSACNVLDVHIISLKSNAPSSYADSYLLIV